MVRFNGPTEGEDWSVVIWNKLGPDGIQGGWYGKACRRFTLAAGQTRFIAFDEDSQGGWAAAPGTTILLELQPLIPLVVLSIILATLNSR